MRAEIPKGERLMAAPEKPVPQGQHAMCILCCWMQESQKDAQQLLLLLIHLLLLKKLFLASFNRCKRK